MEIKDFVYTKSFRKIYHMFRSLENQKGKFVLIIGSPGTGKSTNIYSALRILDLNIYDPTLFLDNMEMGSSEVFHEFFKTLRQDLGVKTNEEIYQKVSEYDGVLLADKILDSEFIDENRFGLSLWTENNGIKALPFYIKVFIEYLKHRHDLEKVNVVIQTAFMIKFRGDKYDLLTDFSFLSNVLVFLLKIFFEIIQISYSSEEIMQIIKINFPQVKKEEVLEFISKHGHSPRFIFEELEKMEQGK
ncbi:MAG: hypothetical protein ACOX07_06410 [Methanobacterium sp.]|uniref:hypothetical protein n=1 Tax=Methanobacterium sp. TaxID=2164 RepID=UPI003D90CB23